MQAIDQEKTHILFPGYQSLQLRQPEQQNNIVVEAVANPVPNLGCVIGGSEVGIPGDWGLVYMFAPFVFSALLLGDSSTS